MLTVCHAVCSVFAIGSRKLVDHEKYSIAAVCDIATIILSQTVIFYCQSTILLEDIDFEVYELSAIELFDL